MSISLSLINYGEAMQTEARINKSLAIVLSVIVLDAMGLGLVMPVLPELLRGLVPGGQVTGHYGMLLAVYALMQVFFAPLLGRLSDRYGRRPVLIMSLAGAAIDYAVMAAAPVLWVIYIGRMIAGITGATGAVAASAIADTMPSNQRARWFGYMGACYGAGMIAGPAIGGLAGSLSVHAPFIAAAVLNGTGFLLAYLFLKETRPAGSQPAVSETFSLREFLLPVSFLKGMTALALVFFIIQLVGQLPATLWVIYTEDRFAWDTTMVGFSLAAFGAVHTVFQAFVTGPLSARFGERRTLIIGMAADACGFLALAMITQSWMILPVLLLLATGGVGMPALQAMLSGAAGEDEQGSLQGTLTSLTNLSSIIGPLGFSAFYAITAVAWNGWVWIGGAALYCISFAILRRSS
nr:Tetracycline resistance protein, class C [uncultured bacterium]